MNRTLISASVCAVLAAFGLESSAVLAQPAPGYAGVSPGTSVVPEGIAGKPGSTALVTWPGFQMTPDGGSRVFVQTTVEVKPELKRVAGGYVLVIPDVKLPSGNAGLPLDTHFFKTPVLSVHAKQHADGSVAVTIRVRGQAKPTLRTEKAPNGYFFSYVDFAG